MRYDLHSSSCVPRTRNTRRNLHCGSHSAHALQVLFDVGYDGGRRGPHLSEHRCIDLCGLCQPCRCNTETNYPDVMSQPPGSASYSRLSRVPGVPVCTCRGQARTSLVARFGKNGIMLKLCRCLGKGPVRQAKAVYTALLRQCVCRMFAFTCTQPKKVLQRPATEKQSNFQPSRSGRHFATRCREIAVLRKASSKARTTPGKGQF